MDSLDDLMPYFEALKISAFKKASLINKDVHNVTIGPNKTPPRQPQVKSPSASMKKDIQKNSSNEVPEARRNLLPLSYIEKQLEYERYERVREAMKIHTEKFELFEAQKNELLRQQKEINQQKLNDRARQEEAAIQNALKNYEDNKAIKDREQLALYNQEIEETRKKSVEILEAKKRERELMKQCLENQAKLHSIFQDIMMLIKNCQDEQMKTKLGQHWKQCKELNELMVQLVSKCKIKVDVDDLKCSETFVNQIAQIKKEITEMFIINEQKKQQNEISQNAKPVSQPVVSSIPKTVPENKITRKETSLVEYVSKENFKWYSDLSDFHKKYTESFNDLITNDKLKEFRFDCKKAVNLSVNAISAVNSQHLRDKYTKLSNLLQGKNCVIGDFQICASRHPKGIQFCTDLLAKKFVLQGDLMVSSNPESAFSFATIIVSLWNESPDFGKLLLAYFFKECPYLVPFYVPKTVDQTDEDFYKTQGYKYIDGQIEKQDKFLKRMTGIMRLYFAILISPPKRDQSVNPHNIKFGWTWFVSVMKLKPRMEITATMCHTFLETIGFEMQNTYKMQFFKLLRYFFEHYLLSLKKIDTGGPLTRIECLIQEFKENRNRFKPPNGMLAKGFW